MDHKPAVTLSGQNQVVGNTVLDVSVFLPICPIQWFYMLFSVFVCFVVIFSVWETQVAVSG